MKSDNRNKYRFNSAYGTVIIISLWLGFFTGNYPQYQMSPLAYKIMPALGLTNSQFSTIFSAAMIPGILFSIMAGMLCDRFGAKRLITVGLVIGSAGACLRLGAASYYSLLLCMIMTGVGVTFMNANCAKIISEWYPSEKISRNLGICMTASSVAMFLGVGVTAYFPSVNLAFLLSAVLSVLATIFFIIFFKEGPGAKTEQNDPQPILAYLRIVVKSRAIWIVSLSQMFILGCSVSINGFMPIALKVVRGFDPGRAGLITSMFTIGMLFGFIVGPWLCQKIGYMRPFMIVIGCLGGAGAALALHMPFLLLTWIALFITGFAIGSFITLGSSFPILLPEIGPAYAGSAGGLIATLQLLGAVVLPTYLIIPIARTNYTLIFILAGACMICASLCVIFLPELGSKARQLSRL